VQNVSTRATRPLYLDSSGLVKLIRPEAESRALKAFIQGKPRRVTSALARVEVVRAAALAADGEAVRLAEQLLATIELVAVSDAVLARAAALPPAGLRSLDAIHLATALALGVELDGIVTYDDRLADAARMAGVTVYTPR
jgi:predicted nucleic acid-binding protein